MGGKGKGKGHRKGKEEDEERLVRTPELNDKYNAPPSHTTQRRLLSAFHCFSVALSRLTKMLSIWIVLSSFQSTFPGYFAMGKDYFTIP